MFPIPIHFSAPYNVYLTLKYEREGHLVEELLKIMWKQVSDSIQIQFISSFFNTQNFHSYNFSFKYGNNDKDLSTDTFLIISNRACKHISVSKVYIINGKI